MRGGGERHLLGAEALHGVEALPAALEQDAGEVDHHVGVARRRLDRRGVPHVSLHRVDLADPAERLQMAGEVGPAHRDADAVMALGQRADQMAAEEARAAEHGDQLVVVGLEGHGIRILDPLWCRDRPPPNTTRVWGRPGPKFASIDKAKRAPLSVPRVLERTYAEHLAQVAELVDALVSGTSAARRGGSSPLLGTTVGTVNPRRMVSSNPAGSPDRPAVPSSPAGLIPCAGCARLLSAPRNPGSQVCRACSRGWRIVLRVRFACCSGDAVSAARQERAERHRKDRLTKRAGHGRNASLPSCG